MENQLFNKPPQSHALNIIWGVSGGIAIYKVLDAIHQLSKQGHHVHVVMTESAKEFVSPMTFECLSKKPVIKTLHQDPLSHIKLATSADLFIIAPATYNIIGKITAGIADDALTTIASALRCKRYIAPAMNTQMYTNSILKRNLTILKEIGYHIIHPEIGNLACGSYGIGKLADIHSILSQLMSSIQPNDNEIKPLLKNKKVLVTAGGTIERIDAMRFIGNHSTGKMGICLAKSAHAMGAQVSLVYSSMKHPLPKEIYKTIYAESAKQLYEILKTQVPLSDILIMNAAVGDYSVNSISEHKISKVSPTLQLTLNKNPDILKELLSIKQKNQYFVGFCAETDNLLASAHKKLIDKKLDLIVANPLPQYHLKGPSYLDINNEDSNYNRASLIFADKTEYHLNKTDKTHLSISILEKMAKHFYK